MFEKVNNNTYHIDPLLSLLLKKNKKYFFKLSQAKLSDVASYEKFLLSVKQRINSYQRNTRKLMQIKRLNQTLDEQLEIIQHITTISNGQKTNLMEVLDILVTTLQLILHKTITFNFFNLKNIVWLLSTQYQIGATTVPSNNPYNKLINPEDPVSKYFREPSIEMIETAHYLSQPYLNQNYVFRYFLRNDRLIDKYPKSELLLPNIAKVQEQMQNKIDTVFGLVEYTKNEIILPSLSLDYILLESDEIISDLLNNLSKWDINKFHTTIHTNKREKKIPLFHYFILQGKLKHIELFLKLGTEINILDSEGYSSIESATLANRLNVIDFLVSEGAQTEGTRGTLLSFSCKYDTQISTVEHVLALQKNVINKHDNEGFTPLNTAISSQRIDLVALLINHKADVNKRTADHTHPLVQVIELPIDAQIKFQLAELLITAGADVNVRQKNSYSVLHNCVETDNIELMDLVLKNNGDINIKDVFLQTPLHFAIALQRYQIISFLIQHGANLFTQDLQNNSPIEALEFSIANEMHLVESHFISDYLTGRKYSDEYPKKAIKIYEKIINNLQAHNQHAIDLLGATHLKLAVLYQLNEDYESVKNHLELGYVLQSSDRDMIIISYISSLFIEKNLEKANEIIKLGLKLFPKSIEIHYHKITQLIYIGEYQKAVDIYKVVKKLKTENIPCVEITILDISPQEMESELNRIITALNKENSYAYFLEQTNILSLDNILYSLEDNHKNNFNSKLLQPAFENIFSISEQHYKNGLRYHQNNDRQNALKEYNIAIEISKKLDSTYNSKTMDYYVAKGLAHYSSASHFYSNTQYQLTKDEIENGFKTFNILLAVSPIEISSIFMEAARTYVKMMSLYKNIMQKMHISIDKQHHINYLIITKTAYCKSPNEFYEIYSQTLQYMTSNQIYLQNENEFYETWKSNNEKVSKQNANNLNMERHLKLLEDEKRYFKHLNLNNPEKNPQDNTQSTDSSSDNYLYSLVVSLLLLILTKFLHSTYKYLQPNKLSNDFNKKTPDEVISKQNVVAETVDKNDNSYTTILKISNVNFSSQIDASKNKLIALNEKFDKYDDTKKMVNHRLETFSQIKCPEKPVLTSIKSAKIFLKKMKTIETSMEDLNEQIKNIEGYVKKLSELPSISSSDVQPIDSQLRGVTKKLDRLEQDIESLKKDEEDFNKSLKNIEKIKAPATTTQKNQKKVVKNEETTPIKKQPPKTKGRKTDKAPLTDKQPDNSNSSTETTTTTTTTVFSNNNNNHEIDTTSLLFNDFYQLLPKQQRVESTENEFNLPPKPTVVKHINIQLSEEEQEILQIIKAYKIELKSCIKLISHNRDYIEQIIRDMTNLLLTRSKVNRNCILITSLTRDYADFFSDLRSIRNHYLAHPVFIASDKELYILAKLFIKICDMAKNILHKPNTPVHLEADLLKGYDIYKNSKTKPTPGFYEELYNHGITRLYKLINEASKFTDNHITESANFQNSLLNCFVQLHCALLKLPEKKSKFANLICPIKEGGTDVFTLIEDFRNSACHDYDETIIEPIQYYVAKITDPIILLDLIAVLRGAKDELQILYPIIEYETLDNNNTTPLYKS